MVLNIKTKDFNRKGRGKCSGTLWGAVALTSIERLLLRSIVIFRYLVKSLAEVSETQDDREKLTTSSYKERTNMNSLLPLESYQSNDSEMD
jgi:hypothetical protein